MSVATERISLRAIEAVRFIKAQLSSSIATAVDWAVVTVLILSHIYYVKAVVCGAVLGAITDFSIKKWWVFQTHRKHGQSELIRYGVVSGTSAGLNGLIVYLFVDGLRFTKPVSVVLTSLVVAILWNYPLHRLFVFSNTAAPTGPEQP